MTEQIKVAHEANVKCEKARKQQDEMNHFLYSVCFLIYNY